MSYLHASFTFIYWCTCIAISDIYTLYIYVCLFKLYMYLLTSTIYGYALLCCTSIFINMIPLHFCYCPSPYLVYQKLLSWEPLMVLNKIVLQGNKTVYSIKDEIIAEVDLKYNGPKVCTFIMLCIYTCVVCISMHLGLNHPICSRK